MDEAMEEAALGAAGAAAGAAAAAGASGAGGAGLAGLAAAAAQGTAHGAALLAAHTLQPASVLAAMDDGGGWVPPLDALPCGVGVEVSGQEPRRGAARPLLFATLASYPLEAEVCQ